MQKKLHIKKGDIVKVISGAAKYAEPNQGRVLYVDRKKMRAIVEGVNLIKKHVKPSAKHPDGGIIEQEAPIHISNLMLVDPKTGEPTRIGRKKDKDGKLVRYSKKSGEIIK
ncbi:MAG: 50S ribosomal protein L24 [Bacteroidetes bacterium]|nr:MAG: 50S ribosomal protein L24 [Bacteroidota bacterium]